MKIVILGAALLMALPAVAVAQAAKPALYVPPPLVVMHVPGQPGISGLYQSDQEMERLRRDGSGTRAERRERAERLAALINNGQCQAAHDAAIQEHDQVMAERIGDVCRPATTAAAS